MFCFFISILPTLASANWSHVDKIDDFTDESVKYSFYSGKDHNIQISRENKSVWMFITRKKTGTFEPNGLIEIRVDKNDVLEIDPESLKSMEELMDTSFYQWEPSTVGFRVWHGEENEGGDCSFIGEIINGKALKVRYQINKLEKDSFKVDLQGAKDAIVNGLDLKVCGSS